MQDRSPEAGRGPPISWTVFAILLATLAVYLPAFQNSFVNLDDYTYITSTAPLSWANTKEIFTRYFEGYHPLSMLSLGLTYHFFEFNPWVYHCTNVLLHLANTMLVFWFIYRLTDRRIAAAVTALLFGIHPVHVEAVAWVTSRKDVLYSFFYLLALVQYLRYLRSERLRDYAAAFLLGVLSVMSKGMAASLPLSLLAIDLLRGRRLHAARTIAEKVPFLALSVLFGTISIRAQQSSGYVPAGERFGVSAERVWFACRAFTLYLRNLAVPFKVTAFHPAPPADASSLGYILPVTILALLLIYCSWKLRPVAFGGLFFVANIVLVLQLVPVSDFIIADRYNYLSSIGILFLVGLVPEWAESRGAKLRWSGRGIVVAVSLLLAILTFNQCKVWRNSKTLWSDVLAHYPDSLFALNMRGCANSSLGDHQAALTDFNRAVTISPLYARSYVNRGYARHQSGNLGGAESDYTQAIALRPDDALAHNNRGLVRYGLGDYHAALADYTAAMGLGSDPRMLRLFRSNRAMVHLRLDDPGAALADSDHVLQENPDHYRALLTRARARLVLGDHTGALRDVNKAIAVAPAEEEPVELRREIRRQGT